MSGRRARSAAILLVGCGKMGSALLAGCVSALVLGAVTRAAAPPKVQFTDTRLKNGLRVIISEDHTAPVFSIALIASP